MLAIPIFERKLYSGATALVEVLVVRMCLRYSTNSKKTNLAGKRWAKERIMGLDRKVMRARLRGALKDIVGTKAFTPSKMRNHCKVGSRKMTRSSLHFRSPQVAVLRLVRREAKRATGGLLGATHAKVTKGEYGFYFLNGGIYCAYADEDKVE